MCGPFGVSASLRLRWLMIRQEFDELVQLSVEAGILSRPVSYEKFVDESFVHNLKAVEIALDAR